MTVSVSKEIKEETIERPVYTFTYTCDGCGDTTTDDHDFNEINLFLNPEDCVNAKFRRHYCPGCLDKWDQLCMVIGADPDDISGSDFDGDW